MNIQEIIDRFKNDPAFAEKYSAIPSMEEVLEQAKADGFEVTKEDVQAAISQLGTKSGELSEADLAVVVGGNAKGTLIDPHTYKCAYSPFGQAEFRDGEMRRQCAAVSPCSPNTCKWINWTGTFDGEYYRCSCYGTNRCINGWHSEFCRR